MEVDEGRPTGGPTAPGPEVDVCRYSTKCTDFMHVFPLYQLFLVHLFLAGLSQRMRAEYQGKRAFFAACQNSHQRTRIAFLITWEAQNPCLFDIIIKRLDVLNVLAGFLIQVVRHCFNCRPVDVAQAAAAAPNNDEMAACVGIREVQSTADPVLGKVRI